MANKNAVEVVRTYTSVVGEFNVSRGNNGVILRNGKNTLNIPNGALGRAILVEAASFLTDVAPAKGKAKASKKDGATAPAKRTRRTKAQMEAARSETPALEATVANTVGEALEEV